MLRHPHASGFQIAINTEISSLQEKSTWEEIPTNKISSSNVIPTMWVFKYKFDENGYLVKFKARLCARSDLQHTKQNIYAAILVVWLFRIFMIIVTVYDLNTKQYNAVNAFVNNFINETIYCKIFEGWPVNLDIFLFFHRAFYNLKQSSAL